MGFEATMASRPLQRVQAAIAARRHFLGRQTKSQIAEDLSISRFKVARLIDAAIEEGIVNFVISEPNDLDTELSDKVRKRFGLKSALVLKGPDQHTSALTEPLGSLAAQLLEEMLEDGQLLGVAWGRTLAATARALTHLPRVDVVQVAGNPTGLDFTLNPVEIVHRIARAGSGKPYPIYAPLWVEDQAAAEGLRAERVVAEALALYRRIDVLVVGIGSWHPPESCLCAAFPPAWHDQALAAGVRADLCATLIDDEGKAVPSPLDQHGLGITAEQLRGIADVVGIGGGIEKAAAIASVLRGGWISTLVTDAGVARGLLA
jgi:DNA-binding transcriptional regulator LsrR (DeoR family)